MTGDDTPWTYVLVNILSIELGPCIRMTGALRKLTNCSNRMRSSMSVRLPGGRLLRNRLILTAKYVPRMKEKPAV